ncbi:MAG: tRNA delta(2)-isopentenylpyrophosphate transferase [Moraxellaceae bacterium]|jgi:tRNA dimethylallyltransferase|nr:tRNA delta(2)-isopentenylpyrophosphate transferase [Moraxellaceae bacterium]
MPSHLPPAILLMGPTASGKTKLAIELVERGPFDIISVDSGMVYRGMDIGTAKPDAATLARAPHRLIDIRDPACAYSAAEFRQDALAAMAESSAAGRIPLLVGGTMLYFKVLLEGLAPMPEADPGLRARLEAEAARLGWPALHARLATVDPASAARLGSNDAQRLQRALEVWELTGKPLSQWHAEQPPVAPPPYRMVQVALMPPERAALHARIEHRFDEMLEMGLVDEVARLKARPDLHAGLPSLKAVGYAQVWAYLDGACDAAEMRLRGIYATRQLAKRQHTWLRRFQQAACYDGAHEGLAGLLLKNWQADSTLASTRG